MSIVVSDAVELIVRATVGNEQELNRETMSSNTDDRTLHELYLWPFADAVKADVASVMCSHNKLNETYSCESPSVMNALLKNELDFQGYVVSGHVNAGRQFRGRKFPLGPESSEYHATNIISRGQVPQSRLDNMVLRILASWYFLKQDSGYPGVSFNSWNGGGGPNVQGTHSTVARAIARDGMVLLKNTNNTLPLKKPQSLAIIGQDAIQNPNRTNSCTDRGCNTGHLAMGWGSGTAQFPYLVAPLDAIKKQAGKDGTTLTTSTTDSTSSGAVAASAAVTAIVFITSDSEEGYITVEGNAGDRTSLDPWHNGNDLVAAVANVDKKTIVVVNSVGPVILESILTLPNVAAVVWAGVSGEESGNGLVDILDGSTSPSRKLPYTNAKQASDYGTSVINGDDNYPEGLYIDYRHFDHAAITLRYEFGFGLSYTTFTYTRLTTSYTNQTLASSGLYNTVATVTAKITNSGLVTGAEVAQLYIGLPSSSAVPASPSKQLRGFQKPYLASGASGTVTFKLRRKDLSYWDVGMQKWVMPEKGGSTVYVGASSKDARLQGVL
ncbi:hypothetical protein MMC14_008220 [Varicellaria rhodocarpa]|nr:hypothetical protein [Varicellaria rhodocarpa]